MNSNWQVSTYNPVSCCVGVGALTSENCGLFRDIFLCVVPEEADVIHSECEELKSRANHG